MTLNILMRIRSYFFRGRNNVIYDFERGLYKVKVKGHNHQVRFFDEKYNGKGFTKKEAEVIARYVVKEASFCLSEGRGEDIFLRWGGGVGVFNMRLDKCGRVSKKIKKIDLIFFVFHIALII